MRETSRCDGPVCVSLALLGALAGTANAADPWIVYDGFDGPGNGKHIVFVTGDEEYRSEESMPQLAKILAKHHGFRCTVLFAIDKKDGTINTEQVDNIPGLAALKRADLMVIFTRFRDLPDDQMKHIVDYVNSGRPIVGIRTATHAFSFKKHKTYAKYDWRNKDEDFAGGFGRQVLGETWINHYGHHQHESTRGIIAEGMEDHPIVRGVEDIWGPSDVYGLTTLHGDCKPIILGQVLSGMKPSDKPNPEKPPLPVAWTKTYTGDTGKTARVFATTMGHAGDFKSEGFRRLMVNACYWALGMEDRIPAKSRVDLVGEYDPVPIGFGKHRKGLKPEDFRIESKRGTATQKSARPRLDIARKLVVALPTATQPAAASLPEPDPRVSFAIRGTKGWAWTPRQYLQEIPTLARFKMNFLMNCYLSMFDIENQAWNSGQANRWWEPLPASKKRAYENIVRNCKRKGVNFCFAMNPNLASPRPLDYASDADVDALWQHYDWMAGLGVEWFSICLDDISQGIDADGQARVVNEILRRLRERKEDAKLVFCPTYYWGDGTGDKQRPYLETLASKLDPDVYLFWTGDAVVGQVTRRAASTFRRIADRRLVLWDNYPVNDNHPTMHLGPVTGRDPGVRAFVDGYMSNPMCRQNEINRIPLFTCAAYALSPTTYDPQHAIARAILAAGETPEQRQVLEDLVEAYPGMLAYKSNPAFNAVRTNYERLAAKPDPRPQLTAYVDHVADLALRLDRTFPDTYAAARQTVHNDVTWMRARLSKRSAG